MRASTRKMVVGISVIGLAVGFLILRGIATTGTYYLTVAELKDSDLGRQISERDHIRVGGEVVEGTIDYNQKDLILKFSLRDSENPKHIVRARYDGPKPDAFEADIEVLIEGTYVRSENLFTAQTLLVKCPSKYESESEQDPPEQGSSEPDPSGQKPSGQKPSGAKGP